jgi:Cellulase (glycosyl hydrolase family 5)
MARRPRTLIAALCAFACVLAWTAPAGDAKAPQSTPAHASAVAPLSGVNIAPVGPKPLREADLAIARARALHAKVVRMEVAWSALEPRGPNQIEPRTLAYTDRLVSDAAAAGIGVVAMVDGTPCWASSAPAPVLARCSPLRSGVANSWPPTDPASYAAFVAYLAQRYGAHGLTAIEIWNEPDQANEHYFAGPEKATRYAAILRAAYPAIKAANPKVLVLGGAIVGVNGKFLRALYAAGIKGYYDGLAVHYYTLTLAAVRAIREVQLANGDSAPLWLDEFGFSSCWPRQKIQEDQACVTSRLQGVDLADTVRLLARLPYMAADIVYELQGSTTEDFGVLSPSGARKPSFSALAGALTNPFGPVGPTTVRLSRRGARVEVSGSAPPGEYMELEAFQGTTLRYRAFFTLNRFNEYSVPLPSVLGTSGLTVRVFQYGQGSSSAGHASI